MTGPADPRPATRLDLVAGEPTQVRPTVTVAIPTYCERDQVAAVVRGVWAAVPDVEAAVWVLDDRSPDGTGEVVEALCEGREDLSLLMPSARRGRGGAVALAMQRWLRIPSAPGASRDTELFVELDGDGSHDPAALPALLAAAGTRDVVLGSRYVPGGAAELRPYRRALSRCANLFARWVLGLPHRDCSTGYRCYRHAALAAIDPGALITRGHATHLEVLYRLSRAGARVGEVPIRYGPRSGGASKVTPAEVARIVASLLRVRLGARP